MKPKNHMNPIISTLINKIMKKTIVTSILGASLLASPAFASDTYFGVGYSALDLDTTFSGRTSTADLSNIDLIAGNRFHKNFAVEGFFSLGVSQDSFDRELNSDFVSATNFEIELETAYGVSVLGLFPISDDTELYGKVGYANFSFDDTDGDKADASGAFFGAGINYSFNDNHFIYADYTVYSEGEYDDFDIDVDPSSIRIGYAINFF